MPKDQYQHVIPRFILRRFQVGPRLTKKQRQKHFRKTGIDPEYIRFYDMETGTLDKRPIGNVYGVKNLYQDVRNAQNINELEEQLSLLEQAASRIVQDMHDLVEESEDPEPTFTILRSDLERLRKFLFIMHYRRDVLSQEYFQVDHPENALARPHLERLQTKLGLQTKTELWLHFMRYFLYTSHSQIAADAAPHMSLDPRKQLEILTGDKEPEVGSFEAIAYQNLAAYYFLNICEAAPGTEFVLTPASFGLWEGLWDFAPLHRLFVISPRLALILKSNHVRATESGRPQMFCQTEFDDVPFDPPTAIYANGQGIPVTVDSSSEQQIMKEMNDYKSSAIARGDRFAFKVVKLSKEQTHKINAVLLLHTRSSGSVSFLSPESVLETAKIYKARGILPDPAKFDHLVSILESPSNPSGFQPLSTGKPAEESVQPSDPGPSQTKPGFSPLSRSPAFKSPDPSTVNKANNISDKKKKQSRFLRAIATTESSQVSETIHPQTSTNFSTPQAERRDMPAPEALGGLLKAMRSTLDAKAKSLLKPPSRSEDDPKSKAEYAKLLALLDLHQSERAKMFSIFGTLYQQQPSVRYRDAFAHWSLCTEISAFESGQKHVFIRLFRGMAAEAQARCSLSLKPPLAGFRALPTARLPPELSDADAAHFFTISEALMRDVGLDVLRDARVQEAVKADPTGFSVTHELSQQVILLDLVSWLAKNRHDVLDAKRVKFDR